MRYKDMKKVIITSDLVNAVAEDMIIKGHIKKAEKQIKKDRVAELVNEGVDPDIAKIMINVFAEYGL
jgi:hypothetical protein